MNNTKVIFLDVDNTIIHSIDSVGCIKIGVENFWIHNKTKKLLDELTKKVFVVLISGRRESNFLKVKDYIPYSDVFLEHGSVVYSSQVMDNKLFKKMVKDEEQDDIWRFAKKLESMNFIIDREGRRRSFWVCDRNLNKKISDSRVDEIKNVLPKNLSIVVNNDMVGIINKNAGKLSAAQFYLNEKGIDMENSVFIGDDENDIELLSNAGLAVTFEDSKYNILQVVKKRKSKGLIIKKGHQGIIDILEKITFTL